MLIKLELWMCGLYSNTLDYVMICDTFMLGIRNYAGKINICVTERSRLWGIQ